MPNRNQPQEFETFQLLFDKDLPTSENLVPFKSFIEREQSFVNQILDYMHAPGKEGFFPHSFLGNAVALLSTRLNEQKINARKIYYRFDGAKTLKLVVANAPSFEELVKREEFKKCKPILEDPKKQSVKPEDLIEFYIKEGNQENQSTLKELLKKSKEINHIYPIIFTEDIKEHHEGQAHTDKFEFTENEISSVIENIEKDKNCSIQKALQNFKHKFILVEILKNNYTLKVQKDEPKNDAVKPKEVYLYKEGNDLYFKAKNILVETKKSKIDVLVNVTRYIENREYRSTEKFKIKSYLSKNGYHCKNNNDVLQESQPDVEGGFSATEKNVTVRAYRNSATKNQSTKTFKEITYRLKPREIEILHNVKERYTYLEEYIVKLATVGEYRIKEIFEKILAYVQEAHSGLRIDKNAYGSKAREANQHAFLAGIFQMDRYRDNTRIFLEQLAGRGLADTILLPLGPNRVPNSIPILIEHKVEEQDEPSVALNQSKDYAKGLQTNRIRFLTTAEHALCVGINLDYKLDLIKELFTIVNASAKKEYDAKNKIDKYSLNENYKASLLEIIKQCNNSNKRETKEKILGVLTFNSEVVDNGVYKIKPIIEDILNKIKRIGSINEIQKHIEEQLERTYYAFSGTRYGRNNHCFSRFLLGYTSSISDSEYKKNVFVYDESNIIKTDSRPKKYNDTNAKDGSHAVTTVVFVSKEVDGKVIIMNFVEGDDKAHEQFKQRKLSADGLKGLEFGSKKIVEIDLFFDITKKGPEYKFSDFFKGFDNENRIVECKDISAYIGNHKNFFNGHFKKMDIPEDFDEEISKLLSNPSTHKDFFKRIAGIIFPFRGIIQNEYDFQAVLDGIFGAYSDKNKSVVLTEYQTGLGNRIDMIIHKKGNPIIGLELKIENSSNAKGILKTAEEQIRGKYAKSVTYKVLEDIDINKSELNKAELIGVVFISDASSAEELIMCSENSISVPITHSSTMFIPTMEETSSIVASGSGRRPKTPRGSDGTTGAELAKRPRSADAKDTEPSVTGQQDIQESMEVEQMASGLTQDIAASTIGSQPSTSSGGNPYGTAPYSSFYKDISKQ